MLYNTDSKKMLSRGYDFKKHKKCGRCFSDSAAIRNENLVMVSGPRYWHLCEKPVFGHDTVRGICGKFQKHV